MQHVNEPDDFSIWIGVRKDGLTWRTLDGRRVTEEFSDWHEGSNQPDNQMECVVARMRYGASSVCRAILTDWFSASHCSSFRVFVPEDRLANIF